MNTVEVRALGVTDVSATGWMAVAAWVAVVVLIVAFVYAWRAYQRAKLQNEELQQPNVAMYMEPAANDWHLVELVVKNFGRTPAFGIRFEFAHPPTVGKYESQYEDRYVDIVPLNLPAEIPYLAPQQEWRIVWDSALDRRELGEAIASRFDGAVTYYDRPKKSGNGRGAKGQRHSYRTTAVLDWATLHPVERLELLTTHDLARQEKQKLELLRNLLTYYHYATSESREEVLRSEITRVRNAADALRDRFQAEYNAPPSVSPSVPPPTIPQSAPQHVPWRPPVKDRVSGVDNRMNNREDDDLRDPDFDEAHTQIINGRHRRNLAP